MANLTYAELVTPERVLFSGEAEAVILRVDGGDTTFLANHSDFVGSVDICVVRIQAATGSGSPADGVGPEGSGAAAGGSGGVGAASSESTSLGEVRAAVHGGFVKVADNKVTIVAGVAELADEINVGRAQRALEAAEAAGAAGTAGTPGSQATGRAAEDEAAEGRRQSDGSTTEPGADAAAAAARARVRLDAAGVSTSG